MQLKPFCRRPGLLKFYPGLRTGEELNVWALPCLTRIEPCEQFTAQLQLVLMTSGLELHLCGGFGGVKLPTLQQQKRSHCSKLSNFRHVDGRNKRSWKELQTCSRAANLSKTVSYADSNVHPPSDAPIYRSVFCEKKRASLEPIVKRERCQTCSLRGWCCCACACPS